MLENSLLLCPFAIPAQDKMATSSYMDLVPASESSKRSQIVESRKKSLVRSSSAVNGLPGSEISRVHTFKPPLDLLFVMIIATFFVCFKSPL